MRILINGVGGPTPTGVATALKRFGSYAEYWLLGVDANPLATGLYRPELFDAVAVVPRADSPDYWPAIERLVREHHIDLALVQPEVEVVEWSRRRQEQKLPCRSLLPDYDLARTLVNKTAMTEALNDVGLVPRSRGLARDLGDLGEVEALLAYPFWIRAETGTSGLGSLLVKDRESLVSWVGINPGVQSFLCSEYLPGRNLACKLLYFDGKPVRAACGERVNYIMAKVAPSGITGNTSFGRLLSEPGLVAVAMEAMERLFAAAGAPGHGFFTVDMKEDSSGKPMVTEVNVRNVAFNACFARMGANFAEDTVRLLAGDPEFDRAFRHYQFDDNYIFLRDVDVEPIVLREADLLAKYGS